MNRRRFLKYAGATAAVVGASVLGLDQMIKRPETTISQTSSGQPSASLFQSTTSRAASVVESTNSTLPPASEGAYNRLYFFFDPDLNNVREETEPTFTDLKVSSFGTKLNFQREGFVNIPKNTRVYGLQIEGVAPNGKTLANNTSSEPLRPLPRTNVIIDSLDKNLFLGLADGPATSPIKPSELDRQAFLGMQSGWLEKYYPPGWPYTQNYLAYGYRIDQGPYTGLPHFAFDIESHPGTRVHAPWGGEIVHGLYDWKFGIANQFGVLYMNHIGPTVYVGQEVSRYDIVATRNTAQSHVHLEYRDLGFSGEYADFEHSHPERILELFTTMKSEDLLKNPLLNEPLPILPYFGP